MRQLFIILLVISASTVQAKNYYISAKGLDTNTGLSPTSAWQTIAKLNASFGIIAAGDSILFKSGETFYGSIVVGKSGTSGSPIVIGSYGSGSQPVITGFTPLTSWTTIGAGVFQVSAPSVKNAVNMVTINDIPQEVGRYPNSDSANGGYLVTSAFSGNTSLSAAGLGTTNWTGAEVVARKMSYIIERNRVSSQSGNTVSYVQTIKTINPRNSSTSAPTTPISPGFGLFIQRDARTLNKFGEWFYDSTTHNMKMYFGNANPSTYTVQASSIDTLIDIGTRSNITITNLSLTGANMAAVFFHDGSNITVANCTITNTGAKAIYGWYSFNTLLVGNAINYSMCSAIDVRGPATNVVITQNRIKNTALFQGMASFYDPADANAIYVGVATGARVSLNSIDSTGYNGIHFDGSYVDIDSNFVNYYCANRNDGGGIYTFSTSNNNRKIRNNIVTNGVFAPFGTQEQTDAQAIYLDGGARGVEITNNSISTIAGTGFGIFTNSPKDVAVRGNTVYNCNGWYVGRQYSDSMSNFSLKKNIIVNTQITQVSMLHTHTGLNTTTSPVVQTIQQSLQLLGRVDSNYYNSINPTGFSWYYASSIGGGFTFPPNVNFDTWKTYSSQDAHSLLVSANTPANQRFEYNATVTPKTISLDAVYIGVDSIVYSGSITLQPFSSAILIKSGALPVGLKADAGTDISLTLPVNSTVLKGSAVGTVTSYTWTKVTGPDQYLIATPNNPSTSISNLTAGTYTFQLKVVNSVGDSALAFVNVTEAGVLPVQLLDFSAKNIDEKVRLQWSVASEINVSHYAIERSGDGQNFENIGELAANGFAEIQINYAFTDEHPLKGTNYYRLVMIDNDATFDYSKTASAFVSNVPSFTLFNVVLNASSNDLKINLTTNYQQKMQILLADVSGRIIYTSQVDLQKGFNSINKKVPAINTGIYYTKLNTDQLVVTTPVLSVQQ
ncbi:MAG: parallel beta-helix repeat containing protein [Ferruginibacter sp.]|uniref:PKD domain-containing protein n=1 Tax=Ferruginibacter sp. TaxID=1940288 RepID=UPI002659ADBD|nr:right-handed parallel beta-helix repeat-containing protein [Ferruginibacter sp.]MDB5277772.1 parallel beta-helix repeat containing protein [Ferruginibacter sp.]